MTKHIFELTGKPLALSRPRITKYGTYDPQEREKEEAGWELIRQRNRENIHLPLDGPLYMRLTFLMPPAASLPKKKQRALAGTAHYKRPDIDNLIKFVMDVGNGILWRDDACIASLTADKLYSYEPSTWIEVGPVDLLKG